MGCPRNRGNSNVADLGTTPFQLVQHDGFQRVAQVRAAARVEGLDETRVRGIELAWIRVALALRIGGEWHGTEQEGIQQIAEHGMDGILCHTVSLGFQVLVQPVGLKLPAGLRRHCRTSQRSAATCDTP